MVASRLDRSKVLEWVGISQFFPGIVANDGVNFTLKQGDIHILLGENGVGKSTLMTMIAGLYLPAGHGCDARQWQTKKQDGTTVVEPGQTLTDKELLSMSYFSKGVVGVIPKSPFAARISI